MGSATDNRRLTAQQRERLVRLIGERTGLYFPRSRSDTLEAALRPRLDELELRGFDEYLALLTTGPCRHDEFQELLGRITIDETSFFRDAPQLALFEEAFLPALLRSRRRERRLRLWSAACSSGEEAYTLAILLHRALGETLGDWDVEVLGTDIAERRLEAAADGRYDAYSVGAVPPDLLSRHFTIEGGQYVVGREIRELVRFARHNLRESLATRRLGRFDAIFCRNVLIYFDLQSRRRVARTLADALEPHGLLLTARRESLLGLGAPLEAASQDEAACYRVAPPGATARAA